MTDFHGFKGAAKRLEDIDLPRIGAEIGVGEDELHAFMDAETSGSGFDHQGRPKMLFEPHVFWRLLGPGAKRDKAASMGLAYPKQGTVPYPSDSYPHLALAMTIDEGTALKSASWGLGQIMGENYHMVDYPDVQQMVFDFMDHEAAHLEAVVGYLKSAKLVDALKAHDWAKVARGYNGPGYAKNGYDKKLASNFAKWAKIKDTPYTPTPAPAPIPSSGVSTMNPNVIDLVIKAATAAAGAAIDTHAVGKPVHDVIGAAVSGALASPSVQNAAVETSTAVDSMPQGKPASASAGVWGSLGAIGGSIATVYVMWASGDRQLDHFFVPLGTLGAAVISLWGRLTAKKQITSA